MKRAIFTYCKKRLDEQGGGWGAYSYSDGLDKIFETYDQFQKILGMSVYTIPNNKRAWMKLPFTDTPATYEAEEKAIKKYHPEMFTYRIININDTEYCCFQYAKNLGREILNVNRHNNQLVYSLLGNKDEVNDYPCVYAENREFNNNYTRDFFKNSDDTASPLTEENLIPGEMINKKSVMDFLQADKKRADYLTSLFYAFINERSGKKRPVLICDKKENIIYWISAVTMLFPLKIAKKICFTTYDYLKNDSQIVTLNVPLCGVYSPSVNNSPDSKSQATNYDCNSLKDNKNVVLFDLESMIIPEVKTNKFKNIIQEFCNGNDETLKQYHLLIENITSYNDFGLEYTYFSGGLAEQADVFGYYNNETQKKYFSALYNELYTPKENYDGIESLIKITKIAYASELITNNKLRSDISDYIAEYLKNSLIKNENLQNLNGLFGIIEETDCSLLKKTVMDTPDIINSIVNQDSSKDKLLYILKLLDPTQKDEFIIAEKICALLTSISFDIHPIVNSWLEEYYINSNIPGPAETLAGLIRISCNQLTEIINIILEHLTEWPFDFVSDFLSLVSVSEYNYLFFNYLESKCFINRESLLESCSIVCVFYKSNIEMTRKFTDLFFERLSGCDSKDQKAFLEKLILTTDYIYDDRCNHIVSCILEKYYFEDIHELARFCLLIYTEIYKNSLDLYPLQLIVNYLNSTRVTEKKWKKAVKTADVTQQNDDNIINEVKDKLINDVCSNVINEKTVVIDMVNKIITKFKN